MPRDDQGLAAHRTGSRARPDAALNVHPAYERYLRAVDAEVASQLTPEVVEEYLQAALRTFAEAMSGRQWEPDIAEFGTRAQWVVYGYHVVRLWLVAVAATGRPGVRLNEDDIDELAMETTARAVNSFRDRTQQPNALLDPTAAEQELKVLFLGECIRHLPYAHRGHRLANGPVVLDEFEDFGDMDEAALVQVVWNSATTRNGERLRRAAYQEDTGGDIEEIVALTAMAIRATGQPPPDAAGPTPVS